MRRYLAAIFVLCVLVPAVGPVLAQEVELTGEIGVDLEGYGFTRAAGPILVDVGGISQLQQVPKHSVERNRSSHYLSLSHRGGIGGNQFATYSGYAKLLGVYFSSNSGGQAATDYVGPELSSYHIQTTLLGGKPFPIQFYRTENSDYALRFEANNRSLEDYVRPALSVIRRYDNTLEATGVRWNIKPRPTLKTVIEYKQEISQNNRVYSFGEDLDLWAQYVPSVARPGDSIFAVVFTNRLKEAIDIVIVNLDSLSLNGNPLDVILSDIPPGQTRTTELYIGRNEIQIGATSFNQFVDVVDLQSNLSVDVTFRDPVAPNDINQTRTTVSGVSLYEGIDGRLSNETVFEYSDLGESVQDLTNYLTSFTNTAMYQASDRTTVNSLTTVTQDKTRVSTISSQLSRAMTQETRVGYVQRRGLSASLSHLYGRNLSENQGVEVTSTRQNIRGQVAYPTNWNRHIVSLREDISLQADNSGYGNDQYTTTLANTLASRLGNFEFEPRHELKYTITKQASPDQQSTELESRSALRGRRTTNLVGDLQIRVEQNYRRKSNETGTDIKNRYLVDLSTLKKFGKVARLSATVSQEWETFGGSAPTPGEGTSTARETEHKQSFRFDAQVTPVPDLILNGNFMVITQGSTTINKYGATVITVMPYIDIPLRSFLLYESRELSGLKPQTTLNVETKLSYSFRRISLTLSHLYRSEKLQFDDYSSHEVLARVSRQFKVM